MGMSLYQVLINELYLQGFSILDQMRNVFRFDIINPTCELIETKDFNTVNFLFSSALEQNDKSEILTHIRDICLTEMDSEDVRSELNMNYLMIKIFLTIERNKAKVNMI